MKKTPYWQKLKDPRWQRKRLEIMERAGFKCEYCEDDSTTLHIHHGYYEKGLEPWEYENDTLWCLCENCHDQAQCAMRDAQREIAKFKPFDLICWLPVMLSDERERGNKTTLRSFESQTKIAFRGADYSDATL